MTSQPGTARRHIHLVIDRSGSMVSKKTDTEGGLETLLDEQAEIDIPTTVTLVQFDTEIETVYSAVDIQRLPEYRLKPRGTTALLDAVGSSIKDLNSSIKAIPEDGRPTQIVFVIMTDGHENASAKWTLEKVRKQIEKRTAKGWTFLFLGADINAFGAASGMGIDTSTTLSYASASGTASAFAATSRVITDGTMSGLYAYSDNDRSRAGGNADVPNDLPTNTH